MMAITAMSVGVNADWTETKSHYIFDLNASFSNKTYYREAKTSTTNKFNKYTLLGSKASYRDSSGTDVSTVYSTQAKSHGGTYEVTNQGSTSSTLKSSYHFLKYIMVQQLCLGLLTAITYGICSLILFELSKRTSYKV